VTHEFDSANSHTASEIFNKTASTGDAWIRQRKESMRAMQSSSKTESLPNQKSSTKIASTGDAWIRQRK